MTETQLRTRIDSLAYSSCLLVFALLAYLNLLFGLYSLFYGALIMMVLSAAGIGYTTWARRHQLLAGGHVVILAVMVLVVVVLTLESPALAIFWLFPLILLDLLILPLRRGLTLVGASVLLCALATLISGQWLYAIVGLLSAVLLGAVAALFAYRYHHHARSLGELTTTDPVTGAFNARLLEDTLPREISRSETTGHPLSLLYLGIDFFDELVDLHGAASLQQFLTQISETLRRTIRAGDSHYYLGQGNFLLLLPFTPEEGVRVIAERIRRIVAEDHWPVVVSTTVSLGSVCRYPEDTQDSNALVACAHTALKAAHKRGHNRTYHLISCGAEELPETTTD